MTPEQYLALPEEKPYLEYVDGMVLQKPMPNLSHGKLATRLGYFLTGWILEHGGEAGVEVRTRLGELPNYRLPDVSFWAPDHPARDDLFPSIAVEIRSPDQSLAELRTKCHFFRENGVTACWLIDPKSRTAEIFEGELDGVRLDADARLTSECLPGFALSLRELFTVIDD